MAHVMACSTCTAREHGWCSVWWQKKAKSGSLVQDRKAMLEDFQARDYDDAVTTAMERLLGDRPLEFDDHMVGRIFL